VFSISLFDLFVGFFLSNSSHFFWSLEIPSTISVPLDGIVIPWYVICNQEFSLYQGWFNGSVFQCESIHDPIPELLYLSENLMWNSSEK
jgi:hypothetical protein